jgi:hypothetical protein
MSLFSNTPTMQRHHGAIRLVYWVLCGLIAAAMGLAASGSGNPATVEPLPDWINAGANLLCVAIAVLVLLPRTRAIGAIAAGVNMIISMVTNILVDGVTYAVLVLPFNIVTIALSVIVAWHHRGDLRRGAGAHWTGRA